MGMAWKCYWCGKFYIGHTCNSSPNTTDAIVIRTENNRGTIVDAGVGYTICDECKEAVKELIKSRERLRDLA